MRAPATLSRHTLGSHTIQFENTPFSSALGEFTQNSLQKVQELVSIGTVEPVEVERLLKHHVDHYMCAGNFPDPNDRAYYHCLYDIKNSTLLWVHQEPWQQLLMTMYGNTISLMDATYKTTRHDLPLFFISVRTTTGYCVVAEFIVQSESATHIQEALSLISWNPKWNSRYFMTDYLK